MGDSGPGVAVQRKLKDLTYYLTSEAIHRHIIIVGHHYEIPGSLEKIVAIVDFELPGEEELKEVLKDSLTLVEMKSFWKELKSDKSTLDSIIQATKGLTRFEAENVIAKSLVATGSIDVKTILSEKKHIIRKSGVLEFYEPRAGMNSVGGQESLKEWLHERGKAFTSQAREYGLPLPKGVLIIGIPGTGKSLISKAVGLTWSMPVLRMDVGALFGSFVGQSEANMRKALKTAEAMSPCVLWIDELEKGLGNARGGNDGGTSTRVFGSFLSWMQEKTTPVFVVATANDVSQLPPEMLRKGRFDEIFFSDLPTREERQHILEIHLRRFGRDPKIYDLVNLANLSDGFSGAELEQVVIDSLFAGFSLDREPTMDDLISAVTRTVPLSKTMSSQIKELKNWADTRARKAGKTESKTVSKRKNSRRVDLVS